MDTKPNRVPLETTGPAIPSAEPVTPLAENTPEPGPSAAQAELQPEQIQDLEERIVAALRSCYDPEIPVNIFELGLIYGVDVEPSGAVAIRMTLTSPACPAAGSLPPEVKAKVAELSGVTSVDLEVVWDPTWNQDMMSEAAKLQLGIF